MPLQFLCTSLILMILFFLLSVGALMSKKDRLAMLLGGAMWASLCGAAISALFAVWL